MKQGTPKGKLIPIGGAEAKAPRDNAATPGISFSGNGILKEVLDQIRCEASHIGLITSASGHPTEATHTYTKAFHQPGCRKVDSKANLGLLNQLDGIFIVGGDQVKLKAKIGGSRFLKRVHQRYMGSDFVIAGTSAGAMVMSELMISEGENNESLLKGMEKLESGFNLLPGLIIDPHFMIRGRFARLTEALLKHTKMTAVGICEDTALIITGGNTLTTIGAGTVLIIEASPIKATNFKRAGEKQPIYVEGLIPGKRKQIHCGMIGEVILALVEIPLTRWPVLIPCFKTESYPYSSHL
jgi:cyanophycinase